MSKRPGETGGSRPGQDDDGNARPDDLDRRRRELDAALTARRPVVSDRGPSGSGGMAGVGNALRLSSEFIAGIVVGAALGFAIDYFAGTSPFGLVVFLLLGFAAGVVNALRSAGMMAEFGTRKPDGDDGNSGKN
ncbi:AtpZ/AtpI family protein [Aquibium sp. ELW1220]|jgi:ATP synthase protein I|uniref:AtpZ/AtpI family protein n=1 Tax=Aquibium sp. ELW1220 TaxID=2976766 RepID=UPI0025AF2A8B|nr:AtpZ/AtpI family protein [Aquibium sp. ELW1220]MDN2582289.1 AtpZ/AtpI family protein [Aquibium sp. ELW1220]